MQQPVLNSCRPALQQPALNSCRPAPPAGHTNISLRSTHVGQLCSSLHSTRVCRHTRRHYVSASPRRRSYQQQQRTQLADHRRSSSAAPVEARRQCVRPGTNDGCAFCRQSPGTPRGSAASTTECAAPVELGEMRCNCHYQVWPAVLCLCCACACWQLLALLRARGATRHRPSWPAGWARA